MFKKPLINLIYEGITKFIITIPEMDDEKFDKLATRAERLAVALSPAIKAGVEGFTAGSGKALKESL